MIWSTIKSIRITLVIFAWIAFGPLPANAQFGPQIPQFKGSWNPVVGTGAVYVVQEKGQKPTTWEVAIVGKEAKGHWMEMSFQDREATTMKQLVTPSGVKRMIVKAGNQPAMELPVFSGQGGSQSPMKEQDVKATGKHVGQEKIATPAGTFVCDHYRTTEGGKPLDVWVTATVSPYGLVKMTTPDTTMTLQKVITGAKTRITERPQKFQMPQIPGMPGMKPGE